MTISPFLDFESLLQNLTEKLPAMRRGLTPLRVVVPSVHLRDWIQIQIAKRLGLCMGFEFSTPQDFVLEVFRAAEIPRAEHWTKRRMEWAILEGASANASLLPAMPPGCSVRDRFAMARAVADRFDQYAHYRPEMIEAWANGKSYLPNHAEEAWQRGLWTMLHASAKNDDGLLPGRLKASPNLAKAIPSVLVIGSGSLDPLLVDVLLRLQACGCEVDVRIVLPCLGFLEDLRKKTLQTPSRIPEEGDPESFEFHQDLENNPLLVSMGRQAAGAFVLLGKLDEQYSNWDEQSSVPPPATLLGHLQRGIRDNQGYENLDLPADSSLRIHACYGPRRELEVLRDELLRAFADIKDLKPEEVLIAVPSLEHYAPLVSAVFHTKENPLPVRLTELPASEGDEVLESLLAILEIVRGGRGRASEVLDLMQLRAVREALGVGDDEEKLEFLADKFRSSGITQGFAEGDEQPGGWKFSMNRLVAGEFFGPQEPESSDDQGFHLPVADSMGSNFSELGTFLQWLADLRSTLIDWQSATTPGQWANRLRQAAEVLLGGEDGRMDTADKCLRFLSELEGATLVDAAVILDWMESETDEANRRAPITGATPFGRLKQLHNTPCRVLALVGMQNDNFPSRTVSPSWDLLRAKPKIWDRNARVDDRQMFLDAVLAPTERLIITASTQNIRTNKSQPFSTCVDELLAAAQKLGVERKDLILEHPLQPFSVKYFAVGEKKKNLPKPIGSSAARLAQRLHSGERTPGPLHVPAEFPTAKESRTDISLEELIAFWKDPAKAFLRAQRIAVPFEEADDRDLDLAPLSLDSLESWIIKDAILRERLSASSHLNLLKNQLRADRALPPGEFGEKIWESHCAASHPLAVKLAVILGKGLPLELEIGFCRIRGEVFQNRDKSALVSFRAGEIKNPEHFLAPWITANLAAAANHSLPTLLVDESLADPPLIKAAITQEAGRAMIEILLQGFLEGRHRPLCYAPKTSQKLSAGLDKAKNEWSREDRGHGGGEGLKESSKLAWRDRDPFKDGTDWEKWCVAVAKPLEQW